MRLIKLSYRIPDLSIIGCSGGLDSMVAVHFITKILKKRVILAYFHHGTLHGEEALHFVKNYAEKNNLTFITNSDIPEEPPAGASKENWWRDKRYQFFHSLINTFRVPIITCHHLDDQVETYLFSVLNGKERLIAPSIENDTIIRPFLYTKKIHLTEWAAKYNLQWIEDPSNQSLNYKRNYIRHVLLPNALEVNPGLYKVISKKMKEKENV